MCQLQQAPRSTLRKPTVEPQDVKKEVLSEKNYRTAKGPFSHGVVFEVMENVTWMLIWEGLLHALIALNNVFEFGIQALMNTQMVSELLKDSSWETLQYDNKSDLALLYAVSWVKLYALLMLTTLFLMHGRWYIFEVYYKAFPYVTERPEAEGLHPDYPAFSHATFWASAGAPMLFTVRYMEQPLILTLSEHCMCCVLWVWTDFCFHWSHKVMHTQPFYRWFHKEHHSVHKPSAGEACEKFTYIDGISHMVCYETAYNWAVLMGKFSPMILFAENGEIPSHIWMCAMVQWYCVGQWQHGGKAVPMNQIPGLKLVMRACGVKRNLCHLHDLHHTKFNYNFAMSGIWDRVFGNDYPEDWE